MTKGRDAAPRLKWWYDGLIMRPVEQSAGTHVSAETIFRFQQRGIVLSGKYSGGGIYIGHLLGLVSEAGLIDMRYHHITDQGALETGIISARPERADKGKIRLHESWERTSQDPASGHSILEEI